MFCRSCGENIPVDSVFCPNCGKNLLEIGAPPERPAVERPFLETQVEPELDRPLLRRRRAAPLPQQVEEPEEPLDEEWEREPRHLDLSFFAGVGITPVLWVMGCLFSVVGFVIGLAGREETAIIWILFGIALIAASYTIPSKSIQTSMDEQEQEVEELKEVETPDNQQENQEEVSD